MTFNSKHAPREISEKNALQRMMRICAAREYATSDIAVKLQRLGIDDEAANRIIVKLKSTGFVDDARFAQSFASDKFRFNKWGKNKIRLALRLKRIDDNIIDSVLHQFDDNDVAETLSSIIRTKLKTVKADSEYARQAKVVRFALSRGYSMDETLDCLRNELEQLEQ